MRANEFVAENLRDWFKDKWVRFGPDGKIRGDCARGDDSEGKPKCLPQSKAHSLGKKGRASAGARKRREDPNPERSGRAINVNTKKKSNEGVAEGLEHYNGIEISMEKEDDEIMVTAMMSGGRELGHVLFVIDGEYLAPQDLEVDERYQGQGIAATMYDYVKSKGYKIRRSGQQTDAGAGFWGKHKPGKNVWEQGVAEAQHSESCPHCGGEMVSEELMNEKKDACYYKVKSRYKVWPSAYASGALVKCRNKGASNWGNGGKKNESSILEGINRADESLHDWFNKEKWVRMDTKGKIKGPCAREPGEGKPKCLPQSKAHSLGKKGRASAAQRKRREDPNPDRSGKAINVDTKKSKG